jgi:hypothetical protein
MKLKMVWKKSRKTSREINWNEKNRAWVCCVFFHKPNKTSMFCLVSVKKIEN